MRFVATAGNNASGQLGRHGPQSSFLIVTLEQDVVQVSCGYFHTLALSTLGNVYGWGRNAEGQLGIAPSKSSVVPYPQQLPFSLKASKCAAGEVHSMILSADGEVFVFGGGACGQIGNGTCCTSSHQPVRVSINEQVVDIASGARTCFALTRSGAVWGWGESVYGNLGGLAPTPVSLYPTRIRIGPAELRIARVVPASTFTVFISSHGDAVACGTIPPDIATTTGNDHTGWRFLRSGNNRVTDMDFSNHTTVTLSLSGDVEGRIDHDAYEIDLPSPCSSVAASRHGALFVTASHDLFVTGKGVRGELGLGDSRTAGRDVVKVPLPTEYGVLSVSTGWGHTAVLLTDRRNMSNLSTFGTDCGENSAVQPLNNNPSRKSQWGEEIANVSFSRKSSWNKKSSFVETASSPSVSHDAFRNTKIVVVSIGLSVIMGFIGAFVAKKRW